jgi:hypothetical protein
VAEQAVYPELGGSAAGLEKALWDLVGMVNGEVGDDGSAAFPVRPRYAGVAPTIDIYRGATGTTFSARATGGLLRSESNHLTLQTELASSDLDWLIDGALGAGAISGDSAAIEGAVGIGGALEVTGQTTLAGLEAGPTLLAELEVAGASLLAGLTAGASLLAELEVAGPTVLADLEVTGATVLGEVEVTGPAVFDTLEVTGTAQLAQLVVDETLDVTGEATFATHVTMGTELTDLLTVAGQIVVSGGVLVPELPAPGPPPPQVAVGNTIAFTALETTGTPRMVAHMGLDDVLAYGDVAASGTTIEGGGSLELRLLGVTKLEINDDGIGVFGEPPVPQQPVEDAATDLPSAVALANSCRDILLAYGWAKS